MDACRLSEFTYDIASGAGWYSSMAGLLAGFALVAVLLPLDHFEDEKDDDATSGAIVVFVAAFFSLLVLAFAYAVLSGRGDEPSLAVFEQLALGGAFGFSTLLLVLGLGEVLWSYPDGRAVFGPALGLIRVVAALIGPLLVLALQFASALDVVRLRQETIGGSCSWLDIPDAVWVDLAIVVAGLVGVVALAVLRDRIPARPSAAGVLAKLVLGLVVGVVVFTSVVAPLLTSGAIASRLLEHITLAVTALGAVAVAYGSWAAR